MSTLANIDEAIGALRRERDAALQKIQCIRELISTYCGTRKTHAGAEEVAIQKIAEELDCA